MNLVRMLKIRKITILSLLMVFGFVTIAIISRDDFLAPDRETKLQTIEALIRSQANLSACKQPHLPVDSPEIMKYVEHIPKIDCSAAGEDWVKCEGSECIVQDSARIKYGPLKCSFTDVIRLNDFGNRDGNTQTGNKYEFKATDVVRVHCVGSENKWSATLTGIRKDPEISTRSSWDRLSPKALKLNVLMFGFDSLSRNTFIRKLPKSYEYLTKVLHGDVLQGYNIVGDGTPQALIPLLTGSTELELPDTRKRIRNSKYVNEYPFIWNDYKNAGYVTAFFEDVPELSTFTYRLNGFQEAPTDHYMRPYYLASFSERKKWPKLCTGDIPRHKVMLNAIRDFFNVYKSKPKFLFGFHGELSHDDYNLIGVADDDLLEFLTDLRESGTLNDTMLILMADHGHRFANIRNTIQGKQEERLPFFSFTFPKWFKKTHKLIYTNFRTNLDKLTTPFDIHETLKSALRIENTGLANISKRSVSLFSKIPVERSCTHAHIEPHWCACLDWHKIPVTDPIVDRLKETLLSLLNNYTANYTNICEPLSVAAVEWVMKMSPNQHVLKFKKNSDFDGFLADLSDKMEVKHDNYQIKAKLKPGDSLFEASINHDLEKNVFSLRLSDVSRTNMYGRQARCVENDLPQLRKYCYCKDDIK